MSFQLLEKKKFKNKQRNEFNIINSFLQMWRWKQSIIFLIVFFIIYAGDFIILSESSIWIYILKVIAPSFVLSQLIFHYQQKISFTRKLSQFMALVTRIYIPPVFRAPIYSIFAKHYGVVQKDMVYPFRYYHNFNAFFTRSVKPRVINNNTNIVLSCADSKILSISKIKSNDCLLIKQISYSLGHFLTGYKNYEIGEQELRNHYKLHQDSIVWSCIFYLAPGDYHRYHCPVDFVAFRRTHILGALAPVKESYLLKHPGVYEGNERVVLQGEWSEGFMFIVFVGATNVGSMTLNFDPQLNTNKVIEYHSYVKKIQEYDSQKVTYDVPHPYVKRDKGIFIPKGAEMGKFNMGSTVVMIFESKRNIQWTVKQGEKVKYGQPVCKVLE